MHSYGHADCGVYAEVVTDGSIAIGDAIRTEGPGLS
jgi:MOSC domain-containing protein YiiM